MSTEEKDFNEEVSNENKDKKRIVYIILLIIFGVVFVVSLGLFIKNYFFSNGDLPGKYKRKVDLTANLPDNPIDFESLKKKNSEIIGWITMPSTEETIIDYPILQSGHETEENFYINHDVDKQVSSAGSIYVQMINNGDFSDFNTVLYGHNMLNKSMFGTLKKYRNSEYFNNNREITVYVPGHVKEYEIISAFLFDDRLIPTAYNSFIDDEQRLSFIDTCKNPNTLVKNVADNFHVKVKDKLITLSTCTSADRERYLVVAKLVKDTKTK